MKTFYRPPKPPARPEDRPTQASLEASHDTETRVEGHRVGEHDVRDAKRAAEADVRAARAESADGHPEPGDAPVDTGSAHVEPGSAHVEPGSAYVEPGSAGAETENLPVVPVRHDAGADTRETTDLTSAVAAGRPRRRLGNRGTGFLLGVFLLAAGFLGGIYAQKHWGDTPAAVSDPGEVAANGTITSINGRSFTVRTPAGADVTVKLDRGTRVEQATTFSRIAEGSAVVVHGVTRSDGLVVATVVSAS
jgi:hypothetical protein